MNAADAVARLFTMDETSWRRHANPCSVWTRFAAIPAGILAVWSRVWIGWWALIPVVLVIVWLFLNTKVFAPVGDNSWAAKGIFGEQLWLEHPELMPASHRRILRLLMATGAVGGLIMVYGVVVLDPWPAWLGAAILIMGQIWRIDRMGLVRSAVGRRAN